MVKTQIPALSTTTATMGPPRSFVPVESSPALLGVRHLQVLLLFLCLLFAYIIRVNMSVAIVAMVTQKGSLFPTYHWDTKTKGMILSAFFWGYLLMNIPAAVIGHSVNNKRLLAGSFAAASLLSIATPLVAEWGGAPWVVVLRICQGLSQGFMMPMVHGLLSKWAPLQERARFATYILGGLNFGTMIVLATSGMLATSPWGWPSIFYMSGGLGLAWVLLWMMLGSNSPESHRFISDAERSYILRSLPGRAQENVKMSIPWRHILTSGPVWATTLAHVGQNWGIWTILTEIPTYFHSVYDIDLHNDGLLTAFPFFLMWLVSFPLSYLADKLIIKGYTSVTVSRKIWNSIGHWGGSAALFGLALCGDNSYLAIGLYTVTVMINCCIYMGFNVNHLDLSPNFARILMGITNGTANITAIIAPLFVGLVISDENNMNQWRIVFFASSLAFFLGNLAFVTLGSGELQFWNDLSQTSGNSIVNSSTIGNNETQEQKQESKIPV